MLQRSSRVVSLLPGPSITPPSSANAGTRPPRAPLSPAPSPASTPCAPIRSLRAGARAARPRRTTPHWIAFVHAAQSKEPGKERCAAPSLTFEEGATGDFNDIRIVCVCDASEKLNATYGLKLPCFGARPWLGPEGKEDCAESIRLLVRTASNSYFPQVVSALSIPDPSGDLHEQVRSVWDVVKSTTKELLPAFRQIDKVRIALKDFSDDEVLLAVKAIHEDKPITQGPIRTAEFIQLTSAKPEAKGDLAPIGTDFFAREVKPKDGLPAGVAQLVVASKLREVVAQIGFTRLEPVSPDLQGEYDLGVETAALGLTTNWLPASELRGEGVFIQFDEDAVRAWEERPAVLKRGKQLLAGYEAWCGTLADAEAKKAAPPFPGVRFYMLHSLSHLLMSAISLECGYAASALRERNTYCRVLLIAIRRPRWPRGSCCRPARLARERLTRPHALLRDQRSGSQEAGAPGAGSTRGHQVHGAANPVRSGAPRGLTRGRRPRSDASPSECPPRVTTSGMSRWCS